ncbi:hypothetical protein FOG50_03551 [Hanseniaspora uvarum]|uniref:Meiosis induction protein kinase IME2/SME1 n=1 Tax=Hanseniaspora uvarum TaxID=29833 RepID=A0A1E5RJ45_HANUV|nr:hypothetical protein FOG50_03551 [Hanseniaspora uvarum]OEJ86905.1 Meiosis induction protein kinase IME2/SME1 [Hanseniaspora uvarum]GMM39420.1 protein kinase [Hanseniaspora uvarum]
MNNPIISLKNKTLDDSTLDSKTYHPQVLTDPKLPPITLDKLPAKLQIISYKDNYKAIGCVGSGSFGTVNLCKKVSSTTVDFPNSMIDSSIATLHDNFYNSQNNLVAVKIMNSRLNELSSYSRVRELKFIFNVKAHKNLLRVFECFIDDQNYKLHIALEVMDQNLYELIQLRLKKNSGLFSTSTLLSILSQVLYGLYHIHENGFFHRDLKPENILVSTTFKYFDKQYYDNMEHRYNYVVKIADYGLSRYVNSDNNHFTAYVSTRWYRSPEILLRDRSYCKPIDIWAFGCVAFECATFTPLFSGSDEIDQVWKILCTLGTPYKTKDNFIQNYQSIGGNWQEAELLAYRLNLNIPYIQGVPIEDKIWSLVSQSSIYQKPKNHTTLKKLVEVLKGCLTWSPSTRTTAEGLSQLSYFANSEVDSYHKKRTNIEKLKIVELMKATSSHDSTKVSPIEMSSKSKFPSRGLKSLNFSSMNSSGLDFQEMFEDFKPSYSNLYESSMAHPKCNANINLSIEQSSEYLYGAHNISTEPDFENSLFNIYDTELTTDHSAVSFQHKSTETRNVESPLKSVNYNTVIPNNSNYVLQKTSININKNSCLITNGGITKSTKKKVSSNGENKITKALKDGSDMQLINSAFLNKTKYIVNEKK